MLHGLIDTHAHMDDPCFQDSIETVLKRPLRGRPGRQPVKRDRHMMEPCPLAALFYV